ncbi:dihydrolipoyl dehydrogenase [Hoyosella subflava]|uniref:Dihydrolipoyl dehydrogenase n=1 Tax=Hoyosella subflava (strain DSM 45089 / JCM 17490 / NBRC 109087 / DQS3-9A1) TaxID=443218 RepID=F6EKB5_HOYSD|nr:dihydrolipoyl dehydrogenase [Hoyosella subflava]AEF42656.1 Dihydrolipoyl dehydrogenase [Hoyosella subflava DQS3-9A1]
MTSDVVVLGGGSAGYATALRAAALGMPVILIESGNLGGTCLHRGCIPTKALLQAAETADSVREACRYGIEASMSGVSVDALRSYREAVVGRLHKGLRGLIDASGITVVYGEGQVTGPREVTVDGLVIQGDYLVLSTGSSPRVPAGIQLSDRVVTSDGALDLSYLPDDVIVLGGGVIGCEFASAWASLGVTVTVVEAQDKLLPGEDEFASKHLARAFRKRGIKTKTRAAVTEVIEDEDAVTVTLESGEQLEAAILLVAVGRGPNTQGFADAGIELQNGFVVTDERLRASVPGVYAAGDIVAGPQLAHRGYQHGIFVAEDIAECKPEVVDDRKIPRVAYSRPEVASVGLSETQARERYGNSVETAVYDLAGNGKSQILGTSGGVKVVAVEGEIAGLHLVGDRVSELIGEAQALVSLGVTAGAAAKLIHAHPTQSEALGEALMALAGKPFHVHV